MQNLVTIKNDFLEIQPLLALQSPWRHDLGRTTMYASTSQAVDNKDRTQGSQTPLELHELQTYSKQISLIDNNHVYRRRHAGILDIRQSGHWAEANFPSYARSISIGKTLFPIS